MVRCRTCGLVRSDPVIDAEVMTELYRESNFAYGDELEGIRATYGAALDRLASVSIGRDGLLDVGCGSGFVLELARDRGWHAVRGVEPSADAIANADPALRPAIIQDVLQEGLFAPESFDAVTLFQVLDHIPEPVAFLRECWRILRPGGAILALNHNVSAWSARLLGERSPIIDVEHTYLYSPVTMRQVFGQVDFESITVGPVRNTYSTSYLLHLMPFPLGLKKALIPRLRQTRLGRLQLTVPLGNLCLIARRAR
jgi:SAM-dependent methyltransferase